MEGNSLSENLRNELLYRLSKYFQTVGLGVLALFGYLLNSKLENELESYDIYLIISVVIATGLLVLSAVLLVLASKKPHENKN